MNRIDRERELLTDPKDIRRQLSEVGESYLHRVVEMGAPISVPSDSLREKYAQSMESLLYLPEDDRKDALLRGFCGGLRLKDGRVTQSQRTFVALVVTSWASSLPLPLNFAREFLDSLASGDNLVESMTAEAMLYVISQHDLSPLLSPHFFGIASRLKAHILDPQNQRDLVDANGKMHLEDFVAVHVRFLVPPIVAEEQVEKQVGEPVDEPVEERVEEDVEEYDFPDDTEYLDYLKKQRMGRFQEGHKRGSRRSRDRDFDY